jgi:hypothetical protein
MFTYSIIGRSYRYFIDMLISHMNREGQHVLGRGVAGDPRSAKKEKTTRGAQ